MKLQAEDIRQTVLNLPESFQMLLESADLSGQVVIAGGFVRDSILGVEPRDVDLFALGMLPCALILAIPGEGKKGPAAWTTLIEGRKVQVVTKVTPACPIELIQGFDFTINQACVAYQPGQIAHGGMMMSKPGWTGFCTERFYPDLSARRLRFTGSLGLGLGSPALRALRFCQRGYKMLPAEFLSLLGTAANSGSTPSEIEYSESSTRFVHLKGAQ